jgi:hypothetical protein
MVMKIESILKEKGTDVATINAAHHDALEFPDGHIVLLTSLKGGQQATILQLPAEPRTAGPRPSVASPLMNAPSKPDRGQFLLNSGLLGRRLDTGRRGEIIRKHGNLGA